MAPTATGPSAPSGSATTSAPTATSASASNLPTSLEEANQRYTSTKLALRTGLANKRLIDRSLIDLESQIYLFEGSYLQSTASSGGNIVKGFDSYLKNSTTSTGRNNTAADIPLEDRIFSLSSATYAKSLELKANEAFEEDKEPPKKNEPEPQSVKKSKKDKDATPAKEVKKKKDDKAKEKERSATPSLKTGGGKTDAGSAGVTPTKATAGGGKAPGTGPKLKRKNAEASAGAATPGGKASTKRKKEDD